MNLPPEPGIPHDDADDDSSLDRALGDAFGLPEDADSSPSVLERLARLIGQRPELALGGDDGRPAQTPSSDPGTRSVAGRYTVFDELGRGGVGSVHRGRDPELGREVALKFLHEKYRRQPALVHRFVEEAQIGGQLQHPGIVPVYELGMSDGRPFFAMKLIRGETLAKRLAARESPERDRGALLRIFEQVCQTVAYAHARGVVHRDLKPANVMIGAFGEIQVVDWGMGKVLRRSDAPAAEAREREQHSIVETVRSRDDSSQSVVGSVMGTPAYMPPEQAFGDVEAMDERSDVFALGAILCEILTGEPPYTGGPEELLAMAAGARLDDARRRLADCTGEPEMVALANRCLQSAKDARPHSAEEVASVVHDHLAALEARAHDARVEAAEAKVREQGLRRTQRLGLSLTAAITLGLLVSLWLWFQADLAAENERIAKGQALAAADLAQRNEQLAARQKELTERELARALEIKRLVAAMLRGVTPEEAQAHDKTLLLQILDRTAERAGSGAIADELVAAELQALIGNTYTKLDALEPAQRHLDAALTIQQRRLGHDHLDTARTRHALAVLRKNQGRFAEAEELTRAALRVFEAELGPDHQETLSLRSNLALFISSQGRREEAERELEVVLAKLRAQPGPDDPLTITTANILATLYASGQRTEEAERLLREVLAVAERALGATHPLRAMTLNKLGIILLGEGRDDEAEALLEDAYGLLQKTYGAHHHQTLAIGGNLAMLRRSQLRVDEARQLLEPAAEELRRSHGSDHPATLSVLANLSTLLDDIGDVEPALRLKQEVLEIRRKTQGERHPDTLNAEMDVGKVLLHAGQTSAAAERMTHACTLIEELYGEHSPQALHANSELASTRNAEGRHSEARQLLEPVLARQIDLLGEGHLDTARTMSQLGYTMARMGDRQRALEFQERALAVFRSAGLAGSREVLHAQRELGTLMCQSGQFEQAEALLHEAVETSRSLLGNDHLETGRAIDLLATALLANQHPAEAAPLLEEALEIFRVHLAAADPGILATSGNLAGCYLALGDAVRAEPLLREQIEVQSRQLGAQHPQLLALRTNLGILYVNSDRFEDALPILEQTATDSRRRLGIGHPWTMEAINGLARTWRGLDEHARAVPLFVEVLNARASSARSWGAQPGQIHELALEFLDHEYPEARNPQRALELATMACEQAERADSPDLWTFLVTLARAASESGELVDAVEAQREAIAAAPSDLDTAQRAQLQATMDRYESAARNRK